MNFQIYTCKRDSDTVKVVQAASRMGIGDIISQAKNKLTFKLSELTYDKDAEKAALQDQLTAQRTEIEKQAAEKPGMATPAEAKQTLIAAIYKVYGDYVLEWQRRALASRQFPQTFVNALGFLVLGVKKWEKELQENPSKELFQKMIDELAAALKAIYVEGKYKGDLNLLAMEIDRTKPTYPGSQALIQKIRPPPKTAVQKFGTSFFATLSSLLLIGVIFFVCILAGSLAANDAIGRSPAIRLVYFVYAAVPYFTPFVLLYYIWRYWKGTYPIFYNMLPLTSYVSQYWIINTLLWPFFFYKDANVDVQAEQFIRLGKALVWNAAPSANNKGNAPNSGSVDSNNKGNNSNNGNVAAAANKDNAPNNGNVAAAAANKDNAPNNGNVAAANKDNAPNNGNVAPKMTEEQNDKIIDAVFNNAPKGEVKAPSSNN